MRHNVLLATRFTGAAILVLVTASLAGCATVGTHTTLSYHNENAEDKTFWMTKVTTVENAADTASIWRCANYTDGPACVQAKLVGCSAQQCTFSADYLDGVSILGGGSSTSKSQVLSIK